MTEQSPSAGSLAAQLRKLAKAVTDTGEPLRYDAVVGSPAHIFWESGEKLPAPGSTPTIDVDRTGVLHLNIAIDHAWGLADLIRSKRSFATMTVARALAEESARAWLFVRDDPVEVRARLLMNELLYSLHEWRLLERSRSGEGSAEEKEVVERLNAYIAECEELGHKVRQAGGKAPQLVEPQKRGGRAGTGSTLDEMFRTPGNDSAGTTFMRLASSVAHGAPHGFVAMTKISIGDDGVAVAHKPALSVADIVDGVGPALIAFALAAQAVAARFGWPLDAIDAAAANATRHWDSVFP